MAHDSFALTLWTHWHLDRRDHRDAVRRRSERFDLAGLVAVGTRDGRKLAQLESDFLASIAPARPRRAILADALRHVEAHRRMVPTEPPEPPPGVERGA